LTDDKGNPLYQVPDFALVVIRSDADFHDVTYVGYIVVLRIFDVDVDVEPDAGMDDFVVEGSNNVISAGNVDADVDTADAGSNLAE